MKKIILMLGTVITSVTPFITTISCSTNKLEDEEVLKIYIDLNKINTQEEYDNLFVKNVSDLPIGTKNTFVKLKKLYLSKKVYSKKDYREVMSSILKLIKNYFHRLIKIPITYKYEKATQTLYHSPLSKKEVNDILSTFDDLKKINVKLKKLNSKWEENMMKNINKLDKTFKKWMEDKGILSKAPLIPKT